MPHRGGASNLGQCRRRLFLRNVGTYVALVDAPLVPIDVTQLDALVDEALTAWEKGPADTRALALDALKESPWRIAINAENLPPWRRRFDGAQVVVDAANEHAVDVVLGIVGPVVDGLIAAPRAEASISSGLLTQLLPIRQRFLAAPLDGQLVVEDASGNVLGTVHMALGHHALPETPLFTLTVSEETWERWQSEPPSAQSLLGDKNVRLGGNYAQALMIAMEIESAYA